MRVFKKTKTSAKFTIEVVDHLGITRRFSGLSDKRQTEQIGRRIEGLVGCRSSSTQADRELATWLEGAPPKLKTRLAKVGIISGDRVSAARPLKDLLSDFGLSLAAKERTPKYVQETNFMVQRVFDKCGFCFWGDIKANKVEKLLKSLRDAGLSIRRSNGYLTALKTFCRWMVDTRQATESPVSILRKLNENVNRKRVRRAATTEELRKLITTTARQDGELYGMSGPERALLYRFCAETGLRANEARTLTVDNFDFNNATVAIEAGYSKHRETDVVPLRQDLAKALRGHVNGKLPLVKVFGGRYKQLTDRTSEMLQEDLEASDVPYRDAQGRYFDFHALRHVYITNLKHAPSRVAQSLARHKSSAMTDRYTHVRLVDERAALEMLPDLTQAPDQESARKTGTDGEFVTPDEQSKTSGIRNMKSGAPYGAPSCTNQHISANFGAKQNRVVGEENAVFKRGRRDSNPQPSDRQSDALTN